MSRYRGKGRAGPPQQFGAFAGVDRAYDVELDVPALSILGVSVTLHEDANLAGIFERGEHLQPWLGDDEQLVDRFDARLLLDDAAIRVKPSVKGPSQQSDDVDEDELDAERYADLDSAREHELEQVPEFGRLQASQPAGAPAATAASKDGETYGGHGPTGGGGATAMYATVPFTYADQEPQSDQQEPRNGQHPLQDRAQRQAQPRAPASERAGGAEPISAPVQLPAEVPQPYEPHYALPSRIKHLPLTENQHKVIASTAKFVRDNGGQAEVLLRVKQANNPNFAFLMPSDRLFPYYRWIVEHNPQELRRNAAPGSEPRPMGPPGPPPLHRALTAATARLQPAAAASGGGGVQDASGSRGSETNGPDRGAAVAAPVAPGDAERDPLGLLRTYSVDSVTHSADERQAAGAATSAEAGTIAALQPAAAVPAASELHTGRSAEVASDAASVAQPSVFGPPVGPAHDLDRAVSCRAVPTPDEDADADRDKEGAVQHDRGVTVAGMSVAPDKQQTRAPEDALAAGDAATAETTSGADSAPAAAAAPGLIAAADTTIAAEPAALPSHGPAARTAAAVAEGSGGSADAVVLQAVRQPGHITPGHDDVPTSPGAAAALRTAIVARSAASEAAVSLPPHEPEPAAHGLERPPLSLQPGTATADMSSSASAAAALPSGPPPAVRAIIDKLVAFVERNGIVFESVVRKREQDNRKFEFLHPWSPHHAYYRQQLSKALGFGAVAGVLDKLQPASGVATGTVASLTSQTLQPTASARSSAAAVGRTAVAAAAGERATAQQDLADATVAAGATQAAAAGGGAPLHTMSAGDRALIPTVANKPVVVKANPRFAGLLKAKLAAAAAAAAASQKLLLQPDAVPAERGDGNSSPDAAVAAVAAGEAASAADRSGVDTTAATTAGEPPAGDVSGADEIIAAAAPATAGTQEPVLEEEELLRGPPGSPGTQEQMMLQRRLKARLLLAQRNATAAVEQQQTQQQQRARAILHHRHFFMRQEDDDPLRPAIHGTESETETEEGEVHVEPPPVPEAPPSPVLPALKDLVTCAAQTAAKQHAAFKAVLRDPLQIMAKAGAPQAVAYATAATAKHAERGCGGKRRAQHARSGSSSSSDVSTDASSSSSQSDDAHVSRRSRMEGNQAARNEPKRDSSRRAERSSSRRNSRSRSRSRDGARASSSRHDDHHAKAKRKRDGSSRSVSPDRRRRRNSRDRPQLPQQRADKDTTKRHAVDQAQGEHARSSKRRRSNSRSCSRSRSRRATNKHGARARDEHDTAAGGTAAALSSRGHSSRDKRGLRRHRSRSADVKARHSREDRRRSRSAERRKRDPTPGERNVTRSELDRKPSRSTNQPKRRRSKSSRSRKSASSSSGNSSSSGDGEERSNAGRSGVPGKKHGPASARPASTAHAAPVAHTSLPASEASSELRARLRQMLGQLR